MILSDFLFDGGMIVCLLEPPLLLGPHGLLLFTAISEDDGTGA
jgi:hypothetical protein